LARKCFEQCKDNPVNKINLSSLDRVSKLSDSNNEETHFFYGTQTKTPTEYELKKIPPTYFKKIGMGKVYDKYREKFIFNSNEFLKSLFSHLPIQDLKQYERIFIFGYNERGKILAKYLSNLGHNKITFVDNYFGKIKDGSKSSAFEISYFDNLNSCANSCFILAMSSHHWITVTEHILLKFPDSVILKIDRS
jgi:hypothetical protein